MTMLCEFTLENYRSYRGEATLAMQAAAMSEHRESLIVDGADGEEFVPVAAVYGPNAGGKSNLLRALGTATELVGYPVYVLSRGSGEKEKPVPRMAKARDGFLFDSEAANAPSSFELYFRTAGQEYRYSISVFGGDIVGESLHRRGVGASRTAKLFEREGTEVDLGSSLKRAGVSTAFNPDIPYLSFLKMNYDIEAVDAAADWICGVVFIDFNSYFAEYALEGMIEQEDEALVTGFLRSADVPVSGFRIEEDDDPERRRLWVRHTVGGEDFELLAERESSGTRKLMSLALILSGALRRGSLVVIDELDAKLHPKLLRYVVSLFTDRETNPRGSQLVFTSQDVSILRNDVFRRDEVWFASRDEGQASSLWSLADMREPNGNPVNKNAAFDKQYLSGRYGASPTVDEGLVDWGVAGL